MSKESKTTDLTSLIAEEVSETALPSNPLDHSLGIGELDDFAGSDDGVTAETRIIKRPPSMARMMEIGSATDRPMAPLPNGMRAWLELNGSEQTFTIKKSLTIIGRVREVADLVIADDELSRHHAALTFADGQFFIEDLDSTNGTFVKDARIKRVQLEPGDIVRVGQHQLKLVVEQ